MKRLYIPGTDDSEPESPSHLPPLPCVSPLPNLSSVAFFSRKNRCHGRRPQPPTPARGKMSPRDRDAELLGASPRRPSVSAIPRPARTASTRRASKSCLATANGMLSPDRARRPPQRRSAGVKSEHAPSSYHLPRNLLPRSESFLTQFEDFNSIEDVLDGATKGLPKSQTTPALLSPNKDITSHRLMRSLDPPLPRSSTYDGFLSPERRTRPQEPTRQLCFNNTMTPRRNEKPRASSKSPYPFRDRVTVGVDGEDGNTSWSLPDNDSALSSVTGSEKSEVLVDPRHVSDNLPVSPVHANAFRSLSRNLQSIG